MNNLEKCLAVAQQDADREGRAYAVLNLNRVGIPLYVIREADPDMLRSKAFVVRVVPSSWEG